MDCDFVVKSMPRGGIRRLYAYVGAGGVVEVPDGVTEIASCAFADRDNPDDKVTKIVLPDSVSSVGGWAFSFCRALREVRWPDNADFRILYGDLFEGCDSLERISVPRSVRLLVRLMLPRNLKELELHEDLTHVEKYALFREGSGRRFDNSETMRHLLANPCFGLEGGFMVNRRRATALFHADRDSEEVRVPDGIRAVGCNCFDELDYFEHGVRENAFFGRRLVPVRKIVLPESVREVGSSAFFCCRRLKSVVYGGSLGGLNVSGLAFQYCDGMNGSNQAITPAGAEERTLRPTKPCFERLVFIHNALRAGGFPSTRVLRDCCRRQLGTGRLSISTVGRDLEFLRTRLNAPIEYDPSRKGFFYSADFELKFE